MRNAKKNILVSIMACMCTVMIAGCGSTAETITTNTTNSRTLETSQTRKFEPTSIKTLYKSTLSTLVTDKTITQIQSDKVFAAVIANVPQDEGAGRTKPAVYQNSETNESGIRPKNNEITALVTSGVITQVQGDTIKAKISQAMKINRSKQIN